MLNCFKNYKLQINVDEFHNWNVFYVEKMEDRRRQRWIGYAEGCITKEA